MNCLPRFLFLRPFAAAIAAVIGLIPSSLRSGVSINELNAAASERLLQYDASGVPQVGTGSRWYQATFSDATWPTAPGPFGYGTVSGIITPIATNLQPAIQYLTSTTYFRKTFTVSAADQVRTDAVQLIIEYNDGFVAYLNGVEVARRNGGPANKFIYHDQPAYNREAFASTATIPTSANIETISLGAANARLVTGANVLAIHLLNASATDSTYYLKAGLQISGSPVVPLVIYNDPWRYFPGVVEPSGNLYDPAQLGSGKQFIPWGTTLYDDSTWSNGVGPFGYGSVGTVGTNTQAGMQNIATSLYTRVVFNVSAAQATDPLALKVIAGYDDGFVTYINGVEVCRRRIGAPNTFTPFDAVADSDSAVSNETITIDAANKLLVPGNNVLAAQAHNYTKSNGDFLSNIWLQTNSGTPLVSSAAARKYRIGTSEPLIPSSDGEEEDSLPEGPDSATDWMELYNDGATDVDLTGWHLTDDQTDLVKWTLPNVSIPAGGFLVVICDNADISSPAVGGHLHTNFKLDTDGEYLALTDAAGQVISQLLPAYPRQLPFQGYARDPASGAWKYTDIATPGSANTGPYYQGVVASPTPSVPGRFYSGSVSVSLSSTTQGAVVRYTTDGTEPTASSTIASGAIVLSTATALRARAFLDGWLPSDVVTHTYLINQSTARQSLPAFCLTGNIQRTFYRPFGVFAIFDNVANNYAGGIWSNHPNATSLLPPNTPEDPNLYNAPMQSGKPAERSVAIEYLHTNATADLRTGAFMRCAGSPYSRQRYVLTNQNSATPNSQSPWSSSATQKPQINLFFRDDVGPSPLQYPLVPGSTVTQYENIRLRAGKNDITNPFIRDEFTRQLMLGMGQVTVRGDFVNLYVNGVFKGYFNICERPREPFFQQARRTMASFDVRNITVITDGDTLAYNELINFTRTNNFATYSNYVAMQSRLDVVNLADYVILNVHAAMADWPGNNYVMDRERSINGLYRFSVWDAEGGYGGFSRTSAYKSFNDIYTTNIAGESIPTKLLYSALRNSPDFRILCADRIQKHFFNGGALTDANLQAQWSALSAQIQPIMTEVGNGTVSNASFSQWINGQGTTNRYTLTGGTTGSVVNAPSRRTALFNGYYDDTAGGTLTPGYFVEQGLWPATQAPTFSQFGGNVVTNYQLVITNPNASGTIYYTTDGVDPRQLGTGNPQGTTYSAAVSIGQSTLVKARVRSTTGEWSPLTEAFFATPIGVPLIVSEIMYNPPSIGAIDGDEFEFLELHNTSAATVYLNGMQVRGGIEYTFASGATLAAGGYLVLASNAVHFSTKYPNVTPFAQFGPTNSLSNAGEQIRLLDAGGNPFFSVTYNDGSPWPSTADGGGYSVVPINSEGFTNPNEGSEWRASRAIGGSPGATDSPPISPAYITEVLTNPGPGQSDTVEIYNPNSTPLDITDWWLSDSAGTPKKYRFSLGSLIPAGGYLTVSEAQFNTVPGVGGAFEFSKYGGSDVVLSSGDSSGTLTGYQHKLTSIPAAPLGVSIGRYFDSLHNERFVLQSSFTPAATNSGPKVGPIVITEVMYNAPAGKFDFIELYNSSSSVVPLFDSANPTNTWRILGIEYDFPPGVSLQPGQFLIVASTAPETFRGAYAVPESVLVYPYSVGGLVNNAGELVALQMPTEPQAGQPLTYIDVDSVFYRDTPPWPAAADGGGASLERINWRAFGDDVVNWRASAVNGSPGILTPSTFNQWRSVYFTATELGDSSISGPDADPDRDGAGNFWEFALGRDPLSPNTEPACSVTLLNDQSEGPFLTLQYRRNLGADGLQYHVDTAAELGTWNLDGSIQVGLPVNNGDGTETVTRRDSGATSVSARRFIRFRVNN